MNKHMQQIISFICVAAVAMLMGILQMPHSNAATLEEAEKAVPVQVINQVQSATATLVLSEAFYNHPENSAEELWSYDQFMKDAGVVVEVFTKIDLDDYNTNYELIKRKIIAEAGNQGVLGMRAVAQVIYDRVYNTNGDFGEGFYAVLTAPSQFAKAYSGDISAFEPAASEAMESVFINGEMVFDEIVVFFYNPRTASASGCSYMQSQKYIDTIGAHEFRTRWNYA